MSLDRLLMIYNAIDPDDFSRSENIMDMRMELGISNNVPVVGYVGRLSKEKDLVTLLKAAQKAVSLYGDIRFLFAGTGPWKNKLCELAQELEISDKVILLGYVQDIKRVYITINLFILTSLTEGLPNTLLEAQAMKVPCVATNVGGIGEIVKNKVNGLLFNPGDTDGISKGIVELLKNRKMADSFIEKGREVVCDKFSFAMRMKKIEDIYIEVMGG